MSEDVANLFRAQAGVDGNNDGAGGRDSKVGFEEGGGIGREDSDAVVRENVVESFKGPGKVLDARGELGVGVGAGAMADSDLGRVNLGGTQEKMYRIQLGTVRFVAGGGNTNWGRCGVC